ncbi:MAG: winged helix-turn-helix transcriptional regulator, partial [Bacteroidales bacterium]|nr:winged helix-turn-helix transcriptional regulator [Bacteroidales bacterium]
SNLVYDRCSPTILPEVSLAKVEEKALLRIKIYRGSQPPYYLKSEGKVAGTYIRVGSNNRLADEEILMELERRRHRVSFDSELLPQLELQALRFDGFSQLLEAQTGEVLDDNIMRKLQLVRVEQGCTFPTRALVLLSDSPQTDGLFANAKIECARFKGSSSEVFLDQKTIVGSIATQAEEAYNFVLRHINKGAHVEGVYTISRWEYPIDAIREVIRNAVVHRDYSLSGKDIKIAIYDDMVEVTSPGIVPPSIDFSDMLSRQSDARNKTIAPVFKHLGLIDQWGNGLKVIYDQLQDYPEIKFKWKEVGMSLQVSFVKTMASESSSMTQENGQATQGLPKGYPRNTQEIPKKYPRNTQESLSETSLLILKAIADNPTINRNQIALQIGVSAETVKVHLSQLKQQGYLYREGATKNGRWVVIKQVN